jgi:hypothetical protein
MRRYVQGIALFAALVAVVGASCRRQQPSLIDRNQPPDTQLWYAPPDSSEYEYTVHMYWRGVDSDGTTQRFIWAIQDTIAAQGLSWNPALRLRDYRIGRITSKTDSVFAFKAYRNVSGVGVRKNRQAFFVAAIDDNGVIDPNPAAVEFVATIARLPVMHFVNVINGVKKPYKFATPPRDTVGMYTPFAISYHGETVNGRVRSYQYFPLSTVITIPGAGLWYDDITDTVRTFPNTLTDHLPAGSFRFAAKCLDDAGAESQVDGTQFRTGVSQVVVDFDPNTWLTQAKRSAYYADSTVVRPINFTDNKPDTVPYKSWVTFYYYGHDDRRDTKVCSLADPDECLNFNVKVVRQSARLGNAGFEDSGWLPRSGVHDSDANSTADSNSVNIASFEYDLEPAAVDENGSRDGTPPKLHIIGNYDPTLDTFDLQDHFNVSVNTAAVDTITWNFYKGIGWPYSAKSDTVQSNDVYFKEFGFRIIASGHDDKRDPNGSAIKTWRYGTFTGFHSLEDPGTSWNIGRAGVAWFPGQSPNNVDELAKVRLRYNSPDGEDLFADLPGYVNQVITLVFYGRDTQLLEPDFFQYVDWNLVPPDAKAGPSTRNLINSFGAEISGRWTQPKIVNFYLKFTR